MPSPLQQVDFLKQQLDKLLPMKEEYKRELDKKIRLEFNYNSNHLEGNTLTYQETELLLIFDQSKGDHEMRELEEMKAHDAAYLKIEEWAADTDHILTEADIRSLNKIILVRDFWKDAITADGQHTRRKIKVGQYKEHPNSVQLSNGEMFHYASPADTPIKMGELIQWYREEEEKKELPRVALAALLHYRFVLIHPFDDGNGRLSRLLMNYVLLKASYPPVIIKSSEKKSYLQALNMADTGDLNAFIDYIAEQQLWSLNLYIGAARGEGVDEPGDLDKKLQSLKRKLNNNKEITIEKNKLGLDFCIKNSVRPFLEIVLKKLQQFDSFFQSKGLTFECEVIDSSFDQVIAYKSDNLQNIIGHLIAYDDCKYLRMEYTLSHLRNFGTSLEPQITALVVIFHQLVYEIRSANAQIYFDKLYDEVITPEESRNVAEALGNIIYKKIESAIENK